MRFPDGDLNNAECGFDGGDCNDINNAKYPDCPAYYLDMIGNGYCERELNNVECGFDGGDCDYFNEKYPDCLVAFEPSSSIGDGNCCDFDLNNVECGFDGGDCDDFNAKYPDCVAFSCFLVMVMVIVMVLASTMQSVDHIMKVIAMISM